MEGRGGDQVTMRELGPVTMTRTRLGGPGTVGVRRHSTMHSTVHTPVSIYVFLLWYDITPSTYIHPMPPQVHTSSTYTLHLLNFPYGLAIVKTPFDKLDVAIYEKCKIHISSSSFNHFHSTIHSFILLPTQEDILTIILRHTEDWIVRGTDAHFIKSLHSHADVCGGRQGIQVLLQVGCVHLPRAA